MANKLIVGSPQAMAHEPSLEPPVYDDIDCHPDYDPETDSIQSPPDLDKKILKMIEDSCKENYDLMSLICDEVARQLGMSTDIDDPKFSELYDNISQPILALLNARDERSI